MNKKIFTILLLTVFLTNQLKAQQDPMYSQYMFNMLAINPAYAGNHEVFGATALFRQQWVGVPGAPRTFTFGFDVPDNKRGFGYGAQIIGDQIGIQKTNAFTGSFSYRMHVFSENDELSLGLQGSMSNYTANYNSVDLIQPYDPSFVGLVINTWTPNIGAGIFYHTKDFYFGISAPTILSQPMQTGINNLGRSAQSFFSIPHTYATTGLVLHLSDVVDFKPSAMLKVVEGSPIEYDLNAQLYLYDLISFGASYRSNAAIVGMAGLQLTPNWRIGYAFDKDITSFKAFNTGTHEIMLGFALNRSTRVANPRLMHSSTQMYRF